MMFEYLGYCEKIHELREVSTKDSIMIRYIGKAVSLGLQAWYEAGD